MLNSIMSWDMFLNQAHLRTLGSLNGLLKLMLTFVGFLSLCSLEGLELTLGHWAHFELMLI